MSFASAVPKQSTSYDIRSERKLPSYSDVLNDNGGSQHTERDQTYIKRTSCTRWSLKRRFKHR